MGLILYALSSVFVRLQGLQGQAWRTRVHGANERCLTALTPTAEVQCGSRSMSSSCGAPPTCFNPDLKVDIALFWAKEIKYSLGHYSGLDTSAKAARGAASSSGLCEVVAWRKF